MKKRNGAPHTPLCTRSHQPHPQVSSKFSQRLPSSSDGEEPSQPQRRQQPSEGLGQANIVNKVDTLERHTKVLRYAYSKQLH